MSSANESVEKLAQETAEVQEAPVEAPAKGEAPSSEEKSEEPKPEDVKPAEETSEDAAAPENANPEAAESLKEQQEQPAGEFSNLLFVPRGPGVARRPQPKPLIKLRFMRKHGH
jgi:hypothetical protein